MFSNPIRRIFYPKTQLSVPDGSFITLKKPTQTKAHPRMGIAGGSDKKCLLNKVEILDNIVPRGNVLLRNGNGLSPAVKKISTSKAVPCA
jgi:hypothetical protein